MGVFQKNILQWRTLRLVVGFTCLLALVMWRSVLQAEFLEFAQDFSYSASVQSFDNFYNPATKTFSGERQSASTFSYKAVSENNGILMIENKFDVRTLAGEPIFSVLRTYAIDEHTGMHRADGGDHPRDGYLFGPRMKGWAAQVPDKSEFTYWHVNYDAPALMEYQDNEMLYGLPVYRYEAEFTADQTRELSGVLPDVGKSKGIGLDVTLQLWVEPYTGHIIKYRDDTEAYYYDLKTKAKLYPWNRFHNQTAVESVVLQAKSTALLKEKNLFIQYVIPLALFILSFVLLLWVYIVRALRENSPDSNKKKGFVLPTIVAIIVLLFSAGAAWTTKRINIQNAEADFNVSANRAFSTLNERLVAYVDLLRGARGLFDASENVERAEWRNYVNSLNLQENYPGIQGLGVARYVTQQSLAKYIAEAHADGFRDFAITPAGTRDEYAPVTYLEPFDARNQRAFGYDMWSEPTRRRAMAFARDSAEIGVSGAVTLKQENGIDAQTGFLMYEALYKPATADRTPEERRSSLFGYAYGAFRIKDFVLGVFVRQPTQLGIEIFDAASVGEANEANRMYQSDQVPEHPAYERFEKIPLYNHAWIVRFTAPTGFGADSFRDTLPWIIVFLGAVLSAGSFMLIRNVNIRRFEALKIAQEMTKSLRTEKARTEAILYGVGDGLFATNKEGRITTVNEECCKLLGFSRAELLGRRIEEVVDLIREDGTVVAPGQRFTTRALRAKKKTTFMPDEKLSYRRKDGVLLPIQLSVAPIFDQENIVGVVEVFRDVTKEREYVRVINEERARTHAILESAAEGIVVVDQRGAFIFFNKEAERLLGQGPRKVSPEKWPQIYGIYHKSEDRILSFNEVKAFAAMNGEVVIGDKLRVKRPDGSMISLRADASPVKKQNEVIGVVFTFVDVSREEEIDKMKTEFVSLASHQLRTPLTAINWYTELLLDSKKPSLSSKHLELVKEIKNASTRMMTLVRSLLNVSRLEMGTFSIDPTDEDVVKIAQAVIKEQQPDFDEKGQIFKFVHSETIPKIRVDKQLLHIIIQNLLSNASKYTPSGGSITLEFVVNGQKNISGDLKIRVIDNGVGIPTHQQKDIFKKLFRASNIRTLDVDGTGLGLYIVKTIIDEAGGSIAFTSTEGKGTTFAVTIPLSGMKAKKGKKNLSHE